MSHRQSSPLPGAPRRARKRKKTPWWQTSLAVGAHIASRKPVRLSALAALGLVISLALYPQTANAPAPAPGQQLAQLSEDQNSRDLSIQAASRSQTVRVSATEDVSDVEVSLATNSAVSITWANPEFATDETLSVRRTDGDAPAAAPDQGVEVPTATTTASTAMDSGLAADSAYTYTVFRLKAGAVVGTPATVTARTLELTNSLAAGGILYAGQHLVSANGQFDLYLAPNGNLQVRDYKQNPIWTSSTEGFDGAQLQLTESGALELSIDGSAPYWSTKTSGHGGAVLTLGDDGRLTLAAGGQTYWDRSKLGSMVGGDDYPWKSSGGGYSPLRYAYRNCTDFVAWRLNVQSGSTSAPWRYTWANLTPKGGNAGQWAAQYPSQTNTTPAIGAVAWWDGRNFGSGLGHVGIVSAVYADGSILIEEYNVNPRAYGTRVLYPSGTPGTSAWPNKFIHIADLS